MFENIVNAISLYAIPFIIVSIVLFGAFKKLMYMKHLQMEQKMVLKQR